MSRAATTRLKVNAQLGAPPSLEQIAVERLGVDPSYQRAVAAGSAQTLIRRIAMFWDWGLCGPLAVARRDDGSLWVVDGQHRLEGARLRGDIAHLPCVVWQSSSLGDEAAAFVALNQQRRALSAVDLFKAALAAGDEEAVTVARVIEDAGLSIAPHQNYIAWSPGMLYCVPGIRNAYRRHGRIAASAALCALGEAFEGQVLRFAGRILEGLFPFYADQLRHPGAFDPDLAVLVLAGSSQRDWVRDADALAAQDGCVRSAAMLTAIRRAYDKAAAGGEA